ncbi:hypothetical protein DES53_109167 [Roseimicrobium gellanilyticum]|uniref:YdhG-like domain-containing protein n=1 Tax=Roseimicrobium gellanilyticum TaxID=748857 RepID=A0A366HCN8_9BACT|nr:DUF1801 domain-containing protein [Roseimicrobium gellanilyticum]RBP39740.1 hypothetical protein DES53_109167 [Roseimicrobium gellanilyticum]
MKRASNVPSTPDDYVSSLTEWQRPLVERLRKVTRKAATTATTESIKWGHLVYHRNGPVLLIRAEEKRVLFGFWRGQLLREIEPRLKPGGKYEMATLQLNEGDTISDAKVKRLVQSAVALNMEMGDPTDLS